MLRGSYTLIFLVILGACAGKSAKLPETPKTFFDSLVDNQVQLLLASKSSVSKQASIGDKTDRLEYTPDSLALARDLDIFRELSVFEKARRRGIYTYQNDVRDDKSNLLIRQFHADQRVPVTDLRFYYQQAFSHLRRIEATYHQANPLYETTQQLTMEFEEVNHQSILVSYAVQGIQKMMLSDSLKFSIESHITSRLD